jgi:putative hydrolase of the HAD superfamily
MQPEPRAILFDLDDTLYPLSTFVHSGFAVCAGYLERVAGLDARKVFALLISASVGPNRGRELQLCAAGFGLSPEMVGTLLEVIRQHWPSLSLPRASREVLLRLRPSWRIGVVTNGLPARQARKSEALGLARLVDTIVYAQAVGDGRGKPHPEAFLEAARRLNVPPARTLFVGNDLRCDVLGAHRVGMRAIHFRPGRGPVRAVRSCAADATISSLDVLLSVAEPIVPAHWSSDDV